MTDTDMLQGALSKFAQLNEEDFNLSLPCWKIKNYKKGDIYNACRKAGFFL